VRFSNKLRNRESQSRSTRKRALQSFTRSVHAKETLEQMRLRLDRNTWALVGNTQAIRAIVSLEPNVHDGFRF